MAVDKPVVSGGRGGGQDESESHQCECETVHVDLLGRSTASGELLTGPQRVRNGPATAGVTA